MRDAVISTTEKGLRQVTAAGGMLTAALGIVALIGLVIGQPRLASLWADHIPMAPSTAILFILSGVSLLFRACFSDTAALGRVGFFMNVALMLIAALFGTLSANHIFLPVERMGIVPKGIVAGVPVGHMSPLTAFCFLLAGFSFIFSRFGGKGHERFMTWGWWLALLLASVCSVLLLAYFYGAPLMYHSGFIPPAATTSAAFLFSSVALLALSVPGAWRHAVLSATFAHTRNLLIVVVVVLSGLIVGTGYLYFRKHISDHRLGMANHLSAVADLKVEDLVHWRTERLGDGSLFHQNLYFSELMHRALNQDENGDQKRHVETWLQRVREAYGYERVFFLDEKGRVRVSIPDDPEPPGRFIVDRLETLLREDRVVLLDLHHRFPGGPVRMAVAVPVSSPGPAVAPLGLLVLRIDPEKFLFPFLRQWPIQSHSAETLLVRREDDTVVFLNPLRFLEGDPMSLRLALTGDLAVPAVQAIHGKQGIVKGLDYRGVPVVAVVRRIDEAPWFLVARMDQSEIDALLYQLQWVLIALVCSLILALGIGAGLIWRHQRSRFYRQQLETAQRLRQLSVRQEAILAAVPDIVVETDCHGVCTWGNAPGKAFFGEDLVGHKVAIQSLAMPDQGAPSTERKQDGVLAIEGWQRRCDGEERLLAWRSRILTDEQGRMTGMLSSARDITELKRTEAELQEKNDELMRFAYAVSHDLKSPLVTIRTFLGYLETDMGKGDQESIQTDLGYIRTASEKMANLLDELLALSRIGRLVNSPEEVPLQAVVQEALDMVAGRIASRGVEIRVTSAKIALFGDRGRLVELFQNLLDNAVKFMGAQPHPQVEIGVQEIAGESVLFVRDNGGGIDPRHHAKLFGLFEKLDPESDGTGIGLALVKRIVEVHGGRIWAESEGKGRGATFYFTLNALT